MVGKINSDHAAMFRIQNDTRHFRRGGNSCMLARGVKNFLILEFFLELGYCYI